MVRSPKRMRPTTAAVLLLLATAAPVPAQTVRTPHGTCTGGIGAIADLGFSRLACEACVLDAAANEVRFVVEPIISDVERTGPAAGRLRDGDVLVAVNDALITSEEGARRLLAAEPGDTVRLTVRREGYSREVKLFAGTRCLAVGDPALPFRLDPGEQQRSDEAPSADRSPSFGATFWCSGTCSEASMGGKRAWNFTSPPRIAGIRPDSRAAETGLAEGDEVLTVDGVRTDTPEGTELFLSLARRAGATLIVRRGGEHVTLRVP
jgi:membrane-associated protease RseP (regulator of RpoE activity)